MRVELTMDLSPARVLSPPHIPVLLQRHISTPGEIRTLTEPGLNRCPLPVGIREQLRYARVSRARDGSGRTRTFGVSRVTDLQSALLAAGVTDP